MLTWIVAAPITTTVRAIPTAVALTPEEDGMPRHCAVAIDNTLAIRKTWLDERIVELSIARMREVEQAIHFALDLSF